MFKINIPNNANQIINILQHNGFKAYVVGGCVRDSLLGRTPKDWDITTNATPDEIIKMFKNVIPTGIQHGTVTVVLDDENYEVTTFRIDGEYKNNRSPESVEFVNDLLLDLSRRDFTMNAIAYNNTEGLIDPFNGERDINNKIIRTVGNAKDRLNEDALRICRAIRFKYQLGFKIESCLFMECNSQSKNLGSVSKERIREELNKLLLSENIVESDELILFLKKAIPKIESAINYNQNNPYHTLDLFAHTLKTINLVDNKLHLKLASLLHDIGKPLCESKDNKGISHYYEHPIKSNSIALEFLERFKYDNDTKNKVSTLILLHDNRLNSKKSVKKMLNKIGIDLTIDLLDLQYADIMSQNPKYAKERLYYIYKAHDWIEEIMRKEECFTLKDLAINGNDLINLGVKRGKEIGLILNQLLQMVINDEKINTKEILLKIVAEEWGYN